MTIISAGIDARGYDISFKRLDTTDGLPHNTVFCINQDRYGFMWFGTRFGLSRYDGASFRLWDNSNSCLINNAVRDLCVYSDSRMYVATESGVYDMDVLTGKITLLPVQLGENYPRALKLSCAPDGVLWIAAEDMGVFSFYAGKVVHYDGLSSATCVMASSKGVFACSPEDGLYKLDNSGDAFEKILDKSFQPLTMTEASDEILIGTQGRGIVHLDKKDDRVTVQTIGPERNDNIVRFLLHANRKTYIATEGGLAIINQDSQELERLRFDPESRTSLADNALYSLFMDDENGLWIGSYFRGISYLGALKRRFEAFPLKTQGDVHCGYAISSFCELSQDMVLVASEDAGLTYFSSHDGSFKRFGDQFKLTYNNIHDICKDASGMLWIGTYLHGINIYDPSTHKVKSIISADNGDLHSNSIYRLLMDNTGNIHIGTTRGCSIYDARTGTIRKQEITRGAIIRDIFQDSVGNIWYASMNRGLFRYDPRSERWMEYSVRNGIFPTEKTVCVRESSNGSIWIGTEGSGLVRYDYASNSFESIDPGNAPWGRFIFSIETDSNLLWIGTTTGLYRYDIARRLTRHYDQEDGLSAAYFNYNASRKMTSGDMYFGTVNGFFRFNPSMIEDNPYPPRTYITSFLARDKSKQDYLNETDLSRMNWNDRPIILPYNSNNIEFRFTSISFSQPGKNEFRYYLEGFEQDYCEGTTERRKEYNNLPPGTYTFHLVSSNEDNIQGRSQVKLKVIIRRPWWESFWAMALYLLILSGVVWLVLRRLRLNREIAIERRVQMINESKLDFFTNVTHEIKTPLTLLKSPLELIRREKGIPDGINDNLNVIERNLDWLTHLVEELLKFRQLEEREYNLNIKRFDIAATLRDILAQFQAFAKANDIEVRYIDNLKEPLDVELDPDALTKIISNLLLNAFKYTRSKVAVLLRHHPGDGFFRICIMDNGKGVAKDQISEMFEPFVQLDRSKKYKGVGIGLALVKTLIELHDGGLDIISEEGRYFVADIRLPVHSSIPAGNDEEPIIHTEISRQCESILSLESTLSNLSRFGTEYKEQGNVLVVEDNVEIGRILIEYFKDKYCIGYCNNAADALVYVEQYMPDVIITDIMMSGMDGLELCRRIKSGTTTKHISVVMLTAKTDSSDKVEGLDAGADAYIFKPFSFAELEKTVSNMLGHMGHVAEWAERDDVSMELPLADGITLNESDRAFITKFTRIIRSNIENEAFSLTDLAAAMGISRSLLYKRIIRLTGISPNDCLLTLRLNEARRKLEHDDGTVSEIAYSVGFSDPSYFARAFKKHFGQTPTEIKAKNR